MDLNILDAVVAAFLSMAAIYPMRYLSIRWTWRAGSHLQQPDLRIPCLLYTSTDHLHVHLFTPGGAVCDASTVCRNLLVRL